MKYFNKYVDFSCGNSRKVILFFFLILVIEVLYLKNHFVVNSDLEALFDGNNQAVLDLKALNDRIGSTDTLSVVSKASSIEENIKFFKALVPELEKEQIVRFVEFEQDISYLEERAMLFLSLEDLEKMQSRVQKLISAEIEKKFEFESDSSSKLKAESSDNLEKELDKISERIKKERDAYRVQKYFSTSDGTMMEIKIHPDVSSSLNMKETEKVIGIVDSVVKRMNPSKYGVTVETGGDYKSKLKQKNVVQNDIFSTVALCVFLLALTIIFYFKTISSLFIVLFPLSFGIASALAVSMLIVKEFSLISAFSFAMLYGLGIDFAIHLLSRYSEERAKGGTVSGAMKITYQKVIPSISSGAITTAVAFFSLYFVEFKGFSDFGIVAGIGVMTSLFAIILLFPAFIAVFEKIRPINMIPRKLLVFSNIYKKLCIFSKTTVLTVFLLFILSVVCSFFIKFEYDMGNLNYSVKEKDLTLYSKYRSVMRKESRSEMDRTVPNYILTDSLEETKDAHKAVQKLIDQKHPREFPRMVLSVFSFVPDDQEAKLRIIKNTKRIIERKINLFPESFQSRVKDEIFPVLSVENVIEIEKLPEWIKDKTREKDGSFGKVVKMTFSGNKKDIITVLGLKKDFGIIKGDLKNYKNTGTYFLLADIKNVIEKEVPTAIVFSLLAVFITLMIMFRSLKSSLLILIPLVTGIMWMIGLAYLGKIPFNLFNLIVVPTVVGIGVDSSIHIYHRYKSEGSEKIPLILEMTGGAVLFSSLTTLTGFLSLIFANHLGIRSIGTMSSLGIVTVTIAALIFFPVLLTAGFFHRHNR